MWVNAYPCTILVAEDADAHANSTLSHPHFYVFMGINVYPHCIQILCLWNSMLLLANAHVSSIFLLWASTHPMTISVAMGRPIQMYAYGVIPIQVPNLFMMMQCPCKFCICCCGPIAIQNLCVHDGSLSQLHPNCTSAA